MENRVKIDSRLGRVSIDANKVIFFPQGLIGFEELKRFSLVEFKKKSPFLLLQSMEQAHFGLVVTDPHIFLPDYAPRLTPVEKKILRKDVSELLILVSVTKIALQSPQNDSPFGGKVLLSEFANVGQTG